MQSSVDQVNQAPEPTVGPAEPQYKAAGSPVMESVGSMIDRYHLLQLIGEGGFGAVYMAEQREPVRRKVALKIIKLGMDTKQVVARFEAERQALAMMDHPNIARVLDGGATPTGRPFFVMELVRGVPITEFCDREQLTTKQRLELFIDVCRAIQHAHQKGVIHRDLKPSNVLVTLHDGKPVPKVIDFGIAKATNAELTEMTLFTEFRQFVGTPEYMSPEQAEMSGLDIDTRADVYSLGVLLYELLTGMHPFDAKRLREGGIQAIQKIICEEEPQKPSTRLSSLLTDARSRTGTTTDSSDDASEINAIAKRRHTDPGHLTRELRGDLDWIIMKCLEKDRTRRYVTANDLAEDLTRHLANQPVQAGPPSAAYRLRKLSRRHRTALAVAALFVLAIAASFVLIVQQWRRADTQRQSAQAGWAEADVQRQQAEAARDEAERVSQFLATMLEASDPEERGRDVTVAEVLDDAARAIPSQFPDSPLIEARLRYTLGRTYMALSDFDAAERQLRAAFDIRREKLGLYSAVTLVAANGLSQLYANQGRLDESEDLQRQALDISQRLYGATHERTIGLMNNLAALLASQGRLGEAAQMITTALDAARAALPADHLYRLKAMGTRGNLLADQGRHREAVVAFEALLSIQRDALGPEHPDTLASMMNIANALTVLLEHDEAEALYLDLIPRYERVHGEHALDTLDLKVNLSLLYVHMKRMDEAGDLANAVYQDLLRQVGPIHPSTLEAASIASQVLEAQGEDEQAERILLDVLDAHERLLGPGHPRTLNGQQTLIEFYRTRGRIAEIEALVARYIRLVTEEALREDADAQTLNLAAWELLTIEPDHLRNPVAALGFARRACEITNHANAYLMDTLGLAQLRNGQSEEAVRTLRSALDLMRADDPNRAEVESHIAEAEAALANRENSS